MTDREIKILVDYVDEREDELKCKIQRLKGELLEQEARLDELSYIKESLGSDKE